MMRVSSEEDGRFGEAVERGERDVEERGGEKGGERVFSAHSEAMAPSLK